MQEASDRDYSKRLSSFLANRLGIALGEMPQPGEWAGTGNTIGSLGLRTGLLTVEQVDSIMDQQQQVEGLFGELGIELGFLNDSQCRCLLELQRFHRCLDQGAMLVVEGRLDLSRLLELLAEFFRQERGG